MKLGQISVINFLSQMGASAIGFVATVFITQIFGSEIFGTYMLIVAVVIWLKTIAIMGVRTAVVKRVSEKGEQGAYVVAGTLVLLAVLCVLSSLLVLARTHVDSYLGVNATLAVIALTWAGALFSLITGVLHGRHRVHHASLLRPLNTGVRSVIQIAAVVFSFGLTGLLFGYWAGAIVAAIVGLLLLWDTEIRRPNRRHFARILSYARYAWLGTLSSQTFTSMDTVVLGFFVGSSLIGIYEASWNLASMLAVFGVAIAQTLYPEISSISSNDNMAAINDLLSKGFQYAGLFLIPGFVGSIVVGDLVLFVYGSEFPRGHAVLVLLVLSRLIYAYADQLLTALNGIDRPDLAFRINGAFVAANLSLNAVLVWQFGWTGAAIATVLSGAIALSLSVQSIKTQIESFRIPLGELTRQSAAALVMGAFVFGIRLLLWDSLLVGIGLVFVGAVVYIGLLASISDTFRRTVLDNIPAGVR